jgi:hypothetical protein
MPNSVNQKRLPVPRLPFDQPDNEEFRLALHSSRVQICDKGESWTEGQARAAEFLDAGWELVLHWVHKLKWNSRHKIPVKRGRATKSAQLLKPLAQVCVAWINLCMELHVLGFGRQYKNAGEWFKAICWEIKQDIYSAVFHRKEGSILDGKTKRDLAAIIGNGAINPFDPEHQPAQWAAADAVLAIKTTHPDIFREFWKGSQRQSGRKGLSAALTAWQTSSEKDGHSGFELMPDGSFTVTNGRGRRTILGSSRPVQKAMSETLLYQGFPALNGNSSEGVASP